MDDKPNVLFIMVDQMRADCISVAGHPVIKTPNLDRLAAKGVRFSQAFVQSAVCVPSRMSFYTGRYVHAHRSSWNAVPLPSGERTMGHYFTNLGYRAVQCGRAHYFPDNDNVWDRDAPKEAFRSTTLAGLEEWLGHEGSTSASHQEHLKEAGYPEEVWRRPAVPHFMPEKPNKDPSGYPVDVREEDSDTAFVTDHGIRFLESEHKDPWFLFLSFWKPHPPFFAPSPYAEMYDPAKMPQPNRSAAELTAPHPLVPEYRREFDGARFDDETNWRQLRATYYALISQVDTHVGRVLDTLTATGQEKNTIILFTSDHGEYMGDHWQQNKEMFYDEAHRVPFLLYDPRPRADTTRGTVCDAFVESIDALPTLIESVGGAISPAIQGRSLLPWVQGAPPTEWRTEVHADWDFRCYRISANLGLSPEKCRGWMIRDHCIKYWHFNGLPDVLFDLEIDPNELVNRAEVPEYQEIVRAYRDKLIDWRMSTEDPSRIAWTYAMTADNRQTDDGFWGR